MKIKSLEDYQPVDSDFAVLLSSSQKLHSLPPSNGTVVFCFSKEELEKTLELPPVLVDVPADQAMPILARLVLERGEAEYWAPRSSAENLRNVIDGTEVATDELAISGLRVSENWIHLRIENVVGECRATDDFLRGLSAPLSAAAPVVRDHGTAPEVMTLRALVLSRVATLAKPVKKYLPSSVVVSLYKLLEKIR